MPGRRAQGQEGKTSCGKVKHSHNFYPLKKKKKSSYTIDKSRCRCIASKENLTPKISPVGGGKIQWNSLKSQKEGILEIEGLSQKRNARDQGGEGFARIPQERLPTHFSKKKGKKTKNRSDWEKKEGTSMSLRKMTKQGSFTDGETDI